MSENSSSDEKPLSKQELDDKLNQYQAELNVYQASALNKKLEGTCFRLDIFENVKKKVNSSSKSKKIQEKDLSKPHEFVGVNTAVLSDDDNITPGSFSSIQNDDNLGGDDEPGLGRRQSRREKKPTTKVDLGYEEPKPIKGVKLTGSAKEIFRK